MYLADFLEFKKDEIVSEATSSLYRSRLRHYDSSGEDNNKERLKKLFNLAVLCVKTRNLVSIIEYSEKLASERFNLGFDFHEVYTAFNVLEETTWRKIISKIKPADLAESLGIVSTVFGAGKETLATVYINLSGKLRTHDLDLNAMFCRN